LSRGMFDQWFFITILSVTLVMIVPLVVVWLVLQVGPELRLVATVAIIVAWGVVSGYKDWIISKRREAKNEPQQV
jgi:hypothetical protein